MQPFKLGFAKLSRSNRLAGKPMKFDHLKDLPKAESLLAMEILWQSLSQNPTEDLIPPWHQQVLAARLERLKSGQENCLPWDQAKERLRTLTCQSPSH
jgi:Putative addiction module component